MKTKDWMGVVDPRVLLVGDTSLLVWKDEVIEYVMFLDYYFRERPYDLGERSRYAQAKATLEMVGELSGGRYAPQEIGATNFTFEILERAPRGKKMLIDQVYAQREVVRLLGLLDENPQIEVVYVPGMQVNFLLQKYGFCESDTDFLSGATPRNKGVGSVPPYYQPVDGSVFAPIIGREFAVVGHSGVRVVPVVPLNEYLTLKAEALEAEDQE